MMPPDASVEARKPVLYSCTRRGGLCDAIVLVCSLLFLMGSIFLLPFFFARVDANVAIWMFLAASLGFTFIVPIYLLVATTRVDRLVAFAFFVTMIPFDVGVVFFFPAVARGAGPGGVAAGRHLFVIGSAILVIASAAGLVHSAYTYRRDHAALTYEKGSGMLLLLLSFLGCICFLWGSLDLYSSDVALSQMQSAWVFVIGSALFVAVALMPYLDMSSQAHLQRDESPPLMEGKEDGDNPNTYLTFGRG